MYKSKVRNKRPGFRTLSMLLFVAVGFPLLLYADDANPKILVLYPEIREPYLSIFLDIADGVEKGFDGKVVKYALDKRAKASDLEEDISKAEVDAVVALGKRSYKLMQQLPERCPVFLGALSRFSADSCFGGISMMPATHVVLENLKLLAPDVREVHIVYSPKRDQMLVDQASKLAAEFGVQVHSHPSGALKDAATAYQKVLNESAEGRSAIWLLPGATVLNNALLADVLEDAWYRKVVVFSSVPVHVKRGALFAVYPDNNAMGERLGKLAYDAVSDSSAHMALPLTDVSLAVNQRTSDHLGLTINKELRDQIDLLLPAN